MALAVAKQFLVNELGGPDFVRRARSRALLLVRWFTVTVKPNYGWRSLGAICLIATGKLLETISYAGTFILITHSAVKPISVLEGIEHPMIYFGLALACMVTIAGTCTYRGHRWAVRIVIDYERSMFVRAAALAHACRHTMPEMRKEELTDMVSQAPRNMSRSLLQIISAGTSMFLFVIGFAVASHLFPQLMGGVLLLLLVASPIYVYVNLRSTKISHAIRQSAAPYSRGWRRLYRGWQEGEAFDPVAAEQAILAQPDYLPFSIASRDRLTLVHFGHFLGTLTFAFCIVATFVYIGLFYDLKAHGISHFIAFFSFLRLFFSGLIGMFVGVQRINSLVPYYLRFLQLSPEINRSAA